MATTTQVATRAKATEWEHVTWAASETDDDVEYEIVRHRADGRYRCACHSYVFARERPKTCKHIEAFCGTAGVRAAQAPDPVVVPARQRPVAPPRPRAVDAAAAALVTEFLLYYQNGLRVMAPAARTTVRTMVERAIGKVADAYAAPSAAGRAPERVVAQSGQVAVYRGERFTFRRAIALGGASRVE